MDEPDETDRPAPALIAALDQLGAAALDVARVLGAYRAALIRCGFPADDALELCIELQRAALFGDVAAADS